MKEGEEEGERTTMHVNVNYARVSHRMYMEVTGQPIVAQRRHVLSSVSDNESLVEMSSGLVSCIKCCL